MSPLSTDTQENNTKISSTEEMQQGVYLGRPVIEKTDSGGITLVQEMIRNDLGEEVVSLKAELNDIKQRLEKNIQALESL